MYIKFDYSKENIIIRGFFPCQKLIIFLKFFRDAEKREQNLYVYYLQVRPLCVLSGTQLGVSLSLSHIDLVTLSKSH